MEVRIKKCTSGNIYKIVNDSWSNSTGWGHITTIIRNSYDYEPHKVKYYNRTWEAYTYQTCMHGAVETIYEDELRRYIENYKNKNNIIRFAKGEKDKVIEEFNNTEFGKDLQELKEAISNRNFDSIGE